MSHPTRLDLSYNLRRLVYPPSLVHSTLGRSQAKGGSEVAGAVEGSSCGVEIIPPKVSELSESAIFSYDDFRGLLSLSFSCTIAPRYTRPVHANTTVEILHATSAVSIAIATILHLVWPSYTKDYCITMQTDTTDLESQSERTRYGAVQDILCEKKYGTEAQIGNQGAKALSFVHSSGHLRLRLM
ncbi:hypothetical protein M422DRAFT_242648 [Sphaerobolus stellatus SS14]|nr:hypothetical protein M422DRAFT_242648 [Sphaerobolus stellatus SS14]